MATKVRDNGDGTFSLERDDGKLSPPFLDPDGSYRKQLGANTDPATGFIASPGQLDAAAPGVREAAESAPDNRIASNDGGPLAGESFTDTETDAGAAADFVQNVASAPDPEPAPSGGSQLVRIPGTPDRVVTDSSSTKQTQGIAGEDRERITKERTEANQAMADAENEALDAQAKNLVNRGARNAVRQAEIQDEIAANAEAKAAIDAKVTENKNRLAEERKRPIDPGEAVEGAKGYYAFLAGLGLALQNFGSALLGGGPVGNPADAVNSLIDRSVRLQLEQKRQNVEGATEQLEESKAEQLQVERNILRLTEQELRTAEMQADTVDELNTIKSARKVIEARVQANEAELATDLAVRESSSTTTTRRTVPGTPDRVMTIDDATIEAAGGREELSKTLDTKVGGETVRTHAHNLREGEKVERELKALAQANGGNIPTTGVVDFDANDTVRSLGARMGFSGKVDAEKANGRLLTLATGIARSFGGPITESDLDAAIKTMGTSTGAIFDTVTRLNRKMRDGIGSTFAERYGDNGQRIFDAYMGNVSRTRGPSGAKTEAF